jgi:hypothetical protein
MADLYADARATRAHLRLESVAEAAVRPAPSLRYDDYPTDLPKREVEVSEAAQRLANALHLSWD